MTAQSLLQVKSGSFVEHRRARLLILRTDPVYAAAETQTGSGGTARSEGELPPGKNNISH